MAAMATADPIEDESEASLGNERGLSSEIDSFANTQLVTCPYDPLPSGHGETGGQAKRITAFKHHKSTVLSSGDRAESVDQQSQLDANPGTQISANENARLHLGDSNETVNGEYLCNHLCVEFQA